MKIVQMLRRSLSNPRDPDVPVTTVVLHATVGYSLAGILATFNARKVSAHYVVEKDGTVVKVVPVSRVAWHAGVSLGPEGKNVNDYSIGIEIVNRNDGKDPYTIEQVDSVIGLLDSFPKQFPHILYLTDHSQICQPKGRKSDPLGFKTSLVAYRAGYEYWRRGDFADNRPRFAT